MNRKSELKVPGGKLLRADVKVNDRIEAVELHGDFFIYPETALDTIEQAFNGLPQSFDEDEAAAAIMDALPQHTDLVGFDAADVADVVKKAVEAGNTDTEQDAGDNDE